MQNAIDETKLHSAIMANFHAVLAELYAYNGRPTHNIMSLNPEAPQKRLREFRIGDGTGGWACHSTGASGPDVFSFVEWFGSCDHAAAVELLQRLVGAIARRAA